MFSIINTMDRYLHNNISENSKKRPNKETMKAEPGNVRGKGVIVNYSGMLILK